MCIKHQRTTERWIRPCIIHMQSFRLYYIINKLSCNKGVADDGIILGCTSANPSTRPHQTKNVTIVGDSLVAVLIVVARGAFFVVLVVTAGHVTIGKIAVKWLRSL